MDLDREEIRTLSQEEQGHEDDDLGTFDMVQVNCSSSGRFGGSKCGVGSGLSVAEPVVQLEAAKCAFGTCARRQCLAWSLLTTFWCPVVLLSRG